MTPKSFLLLSAATVVAIGLAVVTSTVTRVGDAVSQRGERLVPGLAQSAGDIAEITVDLGDDKTVMTLKDGVFLDQSGFPVSPDLPRRMVSALALMTIEERKTSDASRLGELKLEAPTSGATAGEGERIVLADRAGRTIAAVILGERDYTVGGTSGGQFVRRDGETRAFLVRGALDAPLSRSAYFDTQIVAIEAGDIASVAAYDGETVAFTLARDGDAMTLEAIPEDRQPDAAKVSRLANLLSPLRFNDVRRAVTDANPDGRRVVFVTSGDFAVTMHRFGTPPEVGSDVDAWVRISVGPQPEGGVLPDRAQAIADRVNGFDFKLNAADAEALMRTKTSLLVESES